MQQTKDLKKTAIATVNPIVENDNESSSTDIATVEPLEQLTTAEAFAMLKNAKPGELARLNGEYWTPQEGEIALFMFTGMGTFKNEKGQTVPCVNLTDENGEPHISGSAMLVSSLVKVTQLPAYVRLSYKGKKQNAKKQQYDDFTIETFYAATK